MASPIRHTGASRSQIPIPSLLPLGAVSVTGNAGPGGAANGAWVGNPGGKTAIENGGFDMLFEFGRKSRCGIAWVHGGFIGLGLGVLLPIVGTEAGIPPRFLAGCVA